MKKLVTGMIGIILYIGMIQLNDMSVVHATNLRDQAVKLAASQVGYHEKSSGSGLYDFNENLGDMNYTKYNMDLSVLNGQPWSATFFWWVMQVVGVPRDVYPARTTVTSDWFLERNMFRETQGYVPQPGDYIILGDRELCGIVECVDAEACTVTYIAGNVSDAVTRVTRNFDDEYIYGYGLIDYDYVYQPDGVNLGELYCAVILKPDTRKPIRSYNGAPVLWTEKQRADYRWLFIRQADGTYLIQSLYNGKVMEVKDGGMERDVQVVLADIKTDNNGCQKWYVCQNGEGMRLIPQHATNFSLHIFGAGNVDGNKLTIQQHLDTNQMFLLYQLEYVGLTGVSINTNFSKTMYVNEKQILEYTLIPQDACSNTVYWMSSDNSVGEIDEDGVLVAKKEGFVTIVCKSTYDSSILDRCTIQVKKKPEEEASTEKQEVTTEQREVITEKEEATTEVDKESEDKQDPEENDTNAEEVVQNGTSFQVKKCWYRITNVKKKTVEVIGISSKNATSMTIPPTVKYRDKIYKVTAIGKRAFKNNAYLKNVVIGDCVTSIQADAFRECKKLKKIVIGKKVSIIGKTAFYKCTRLKVIKIKSTKLKKIGNKAFKEIDKNPTIYAPKSKLKKYQKLFKGKV